MTGQLFQVKRIEMLLAKRTKDKYLLVTNLTEKGRRLTEELRKIRNIKTDSI